MVEKFGNDLVLAEKLAAGGMAEVYRAIQFGHGGFEKVIALKRILPHFAADEEFKHMFQMEANLSGLLQHPNVATIYANGEWEGYLYLLMEFVDGKNVRQLLARADKKRIKIPIQFACYLISEACKGLEYAHNFADPKTGEPLNIVHRDMSPQNIMLSYDGGAKIVDFGIAKAAARSENTRAGILKGKFGYMSPEQAQGMPLDRRTDVFAMGIIIFELLTQRRLFSHDDDMRTLQLVRDCKVPRPSSYNPDVGPTLDRIVLQALAKNKAERYNSASELYADLVRFMNSRYPEFIPTDFSKFLRKIFDTDIAEEKKKREKIAAEMPARVGNASTSAVKTEKKVKIRDEESTNLEEMENGTGLTSADIEGLESVGGKGLTLKGGSKLIQSPDSPVDVGDHSLPNPENNSDPAIPPSSSAPVESKIAATGFKTSHLSLSLPGSSSPKAPTNSNGMAFKSHNSLQMSRVASSVVPAPTDKKTNLADPKNPSGVTPSTVPGTPPSKTPSSVNVSMTPGPNKPGGTGVYKPSPTNNPTYRAAPSINSTPASRPSIGRESSSSAGTFLMIALVVILGGGGFWLFVKPDTSGPTPAGCAEGKEPDGTGKCVVAAGTGVGTTPTPVVCGADQVLSGGQCIAKAPDVEAIPLYVPPENSGILKLVAYPLLSVREIRVDDKLLADKSGKKISGSVRQVDIGPGSHTIEIIGSPFPKTWKGSVIIKQNVITSLEVELQ